MSDTPTAEDQHGGPIVLNLSMEEAVSLYDLVNHEAHVAEREGFENDYAGIRDKLRRQI